MKSRSVPLAVAVLFLCSGAAWTQSERRQGDGRGKREENAQRGQGRDARGGEQRGGGRERGGGAPDARRLLEYDADGNLLIEEQELRNGLTGLQKDAAAALTLVMQGVDVNGDGTLGDDEAEKLADGVRTLSAVRRADRNRDWKLDDDEMSALWEQMARACQQYNQDLLQRFDKDGDGKLSTQETAEAKQQMPERGRGGRGGVQRGGEGRREDRGNRGEGRPEPRR